jgi:hypothetical protein
LLKRLLFEPISMSPKPRGAAGDAIARPGLAVEGEPELEVGQLVSPSLRTGAPTVTPRVDCAAVTSWVQVAISLCGDYSLYSVLL